MGKIIGAIISLVVVAGVGLGVIAMLGGFQHLRLQRMPTTPDSRSHRAVLCYSM